MGKTIIGDKNMTVEQITKTTRLYTFENKLDKKKSEEFSKEDKIYVRKGLEQLETVINSKLIKKWAVSYYLVELNTMETVLIERRVYKTRNAASNQFRKD